MHASCATCSGNLSDPKDKTLRIQQMFPNRNEINSRVYRFNSSSCHSKLCVLILSFFFLQLALPESIFAITPVDETAPAFNAKLEDTAEVIAAKVLENEKSVIVTVVDLLNGITWERDSITDSLEENLTEMLYKKLPLQVIPYFEIVYLRLEWKSTFPEIKDDPLAEDIAKLTNADWLLTGTHLSADGLLTLHLKLFEIQSGDLLWQTFVESEREAEVGLQEYSQLNEVPESSETEALDYTLNYAPQIPPSPTIPQSARHHALEQESEKYKVELLTETPATKTNVARHHALEMEQEIEKDEAELLTETPAVKTEVARHHALEQKTELEKEDMSELSPAVLLEKDKEEVPLVPEGMVLISEGEFLMGSYQGDEDELPDHLVYIESFYLDQHEVTNEAYSKCIECERGSGGFDTFDPLQPVVYVDWKNADAYCKSQNKRLPTEAEWEYAARAGSAGEYSFGDNLSLLENYAWIKSNTVDKGSWGAKKVSGKQSNWWGVHDLYGNVMEWVRNYYTPDYFPYIREPNLHNGLNSPVDEEYPLRVVRGGAWGGLHGAGTPDGVRSANRYAFAEWTRSFQIGFRCAMDISGKSFK